MKVLIIAESRKERIPAAELEPITDAILDAVGEGVEVQYLELASSSVRMRLLARAHARKMKVRKRRNREIPLHAHGGADRLTFIEGTFEHSRGLA